MGRADILIGCAAAVSACLGLAACGGGGHVDSTPAPPTAAASANLMDPASWTVGPIVNGLDVSVGVPRAVVATADGFAIDLPQAGGHADYVTRPIGSLTGASRIVMLYRVDMAPGVQIEPTNYPANDVSEITLFFQRKGDDWSAAGKYEAYRWYATFDTNMPITPGEHSLSASLIDNWTAVLTSTTANNPAGFADAKANAESVGFVLGGGTGVGHGVFATGQARITVTDFEVQ